MNYSKIYKDLCERGKLERKTRGSNLEKHHVIPVFFFKDNTRNLRHKDGIYDGNGEHVGNISYLTPREHFIAHLLLCKIWKNTKWEYRCYCSLKMFLNKGQLNEKRSVFENSSKVYEKYRIETNSKISKGKMGTMPAKDSITGERVGIVEMNHPNVISGKWVHITKGMKQSSARIEMQKETMRGLGNSNSKYTDEQLLDSFKKCCYHYGKTVSGSLWIIYSKANGLPYLTSWKKFRFDNRGFDGMWQELIKSAKADDIEIEIIQNFATKQWREFVKKEKQKWESR
jgi:hypothetical protein